MSQLVSEISVISSQTTSLRRSKKNRRGPQAGYAFSSSENVFAFFFFGLGFACCLAISQNSHELETLSLRTVTDRVERLVSFCWNEDAIHLVTCLGPVSYLRYGLRIKSQHFGTWVGTKKKWLTWEPNSAYRLLFFFFFFLPVGFHTLSPSLFSFCLFFSFPILHFGTQHLDAVAIEWGDARAIMSLTSRYHVPLPCTRPRPRWRDRGGTRASLGRRLWAGLRIYGWMIPPFQHSVVKYLVRRKPHEVIVSLPSRASVRLTWDK